VSKLRVPVQCDPVAHADVGDFRRAIIWGEHDLVLHESEVHLLEA